jgi:hypothetical protein
VLAQLDETDGVEGSFVNESGTVLRVNLRPGADPGKVAEEVRRILGEQVEDRVPVQLGGEAAAAALQEAEWQDKSRLAELAAIEARTSVARGSVLLAALLLGCVAVGLGLFWWRRRRQLGAASERRAAA